ncbi:MAG: hypothetical protein IPJ81_07025 [Chitinophagaceae bacterium]|nr:hypothetical protein [Chitinophagaceae bacterium]
MTENEYIAVSDLHIVISALKILSDICPENSTVIKEEDFKNVISTMRGWQNNLFKEISDLDI